MGGLCWSSDQQRSLLSLPFITSMAKSTLLLGSLTAMTASALAAPASNFPDCASGPLANNSVCDTSLGELPGQT